MRQTVRLLLAMVAATFALSVSAQEFPSRWFFGKDYNAPIQEAWENQGVIRATDIGDAELKIVKADGSRVDNCLLMYNKPVAGPVSEGDCILVEFPETDLPAGSFLEFDITFAAEEGAPSKWIFEYFDGTWKSGRTYTVYGSVFESKHQFTSVLETFRLTDRAEGTLKMRMRALKSNPVKPLDSVAAKQKASVVIQGSSYLGMYVQNLGTAAPSDTLKTIYIGNSFTYYCSSPALLKEIAWNEGHYIEMTPALKGGAYFSQHLKFKTTSDAIARGDFDLAIMQDHSKCPVAVGKDKKEAAQYLDAASALAEKIRATSPDCRFIIEYRSSTTAKNDFYGCGSLDKYNKMTLRGTKLMAKAMGGAELSHITDAFMIVRRDRPDIVILAPDGTHPSMLGAYLKSCINYLTIYGEKFGSNPANCGIDPEVAAYLRSVAEKVVLAR